jgi:hypothetical protein
MRKRARKTGSRKSHEAAERQVQLLQQLKEIALAVGLDVREEKLQRDVGYSVHSGSCRVGGREIVLLDSNTAVPERIDVLLDVLAEVDVESVYIEPELRERIHGRAAGRTLRPVDHGSTDEAERSVDPAPA